MFIPLAFRFKQMLVVGASPKTALPKTEKKAKVKKLKENTQKDKDQEKPKKRGRPRIRRLSSVDSVESIEPATPTTVDVETTEFLSKLSSPTKKRDSLLGYFPKKESPKEMVVKQAVVEEIKKSETVLKTETPRGRGRKAASNQTTTPLLTNAVIEEEPITEMGTPSGRPRRSCAGKARYDYDLEESPSKQVLQIKDTPGRKPTTRNVSTPILKATPEVKEENSIDIIVLDDSTNMSASGGNVTPQGTPKKLAPLFMRSLPKPSPDPEMLKARKAFLHSGVPEKLRLEQEKQKQYEQSYEEAIEIFPKIAHIKQLTGADQEFNKQMVKFSFKLHNEESLLETTSPTRRGKAKANKRLTVLGTLSDCTASDFQVIVILFGNNALYREIIHPTKHISKQGVNFSLVLKKI